MHTERTNLTEKFQDASSSMGTNGLQVNTRTRLRDQERSPIAADLKRAMREKATLGVRRFALTAEVKEAHRQVPIHPRDWHFLGCRVEAGADVYINTVGTFGVASTSCYWSRVSSALGRLSQYLAAASAHTWHMVVADDYHLEENTIASRCSLSFSSATRLGYHSLGTRRQVARELVVWVGFELLHSTHHLGISQRRAEWFTKSAREVADSDQVHMGREEGLGRIMFAVGALELERPFLGPLHRFMSLHSRSSVRRVPPNLRFFLRYLADRVSGSRHYNCAVSMESTTVAPRVDAQGSSERTGIGGWFPHRGQDGKSEERGSRWFSLELNEEDWPWIYALGRKPALIISTLESLAVLVALKLLYGETPRERHTRVQIVPTITDNRGNGALLNKLMSTKFPASAVLMELASYMRRMSLRTVVEWAPREGNKEVDKLANGMQKTLTRA